MDMLEPQKWFEYAIFDEDGVCGIKDNAPDEIKKEYEQYLELQEKTKKEGIRL